MRNYEIIATLGPASDAEAAWSSILAAGATAFRLNTSHLEYFGRGRNDLDDISERVWKLSCPVMIAGDVSEHLTDAATPIRAEVYAMYDALILGNRGFVLSDETVMERSPLDICQSAAMFRSEGS